MPAKQQAPGAAEKRKASVAADKLPASPKEHVDDFSRSLATEADLAALLKHVELTDKGRKCLEDSGCAPVGDLVVILRLPAVDLSGDRRCGIALRDKQTPRARRYARSAKA